MRLTSTGRLGLAAANAGLTDTNHIVHIQTGGYRGGGTDNIGLLIGADIGDTTFTDSTRKIGGISFPHFDTDEKPFNAIRFDSASGSSNLVIGGTGETNATELIQFNVASDDTDSSTLVEAFRVTSSGTVFNNDTTSTLDFVVKSDNNANLLTVDASHDRLGVGSVGQTNVGVALDLNPSASSLKVTNTTDDYQSINIWSVLGNNTNDTDCNFYAGYGQSAHRYFVAGNGNVTNVNNSYGAISDINLKENISDASSQWDDIKGVRVRKFSFKSDNLDKANMIGVVAQELETVSPNLVEDKNKLNDILEITDTDKTITDESGNVIDNPNYGKPKPNPDFGLHIEGETYKTVKYSVLYMKAIKALQEAMERIETLETSNADLIKRVKTLEDA